MGLTAGQVRYRAGKAGAPISPKQWEAFLEWGLLPEPPADGYPDQVVERAIEVVRLGGEQTSLPRRLLRLNDARYPRQPELTRRAMLTVLPRITRPASKMRRVRNALQVWSQRQHSRFLEIRPRALPVPGSPQQWAAALESVPDEQFGMLVQSAHYVAEALAVNVRGTDASLDDIPQEERLILITTLDALAQRGEQRLAAR